MKSSMIKQAKLLLLMAGGQGEPSKKNVGQQLSINSTVNGQVTSKPSTRFK